MRIKNDLMLAIFGVYQEFSSMYQNLCKKFTMIGTIEN